MFSKSNAIFCLVFIGFFAPSVRAIGEGVIDVNTLLGVFGGMANIFTEFNTTDIDTQNIMGKWHQIYKAAINFDVFQTNMYCHVAYFTPNKIMGPQGFSIEEAYHVIGKNGPIETYKRDVTKTGSGEYWMYTEEYFYPRQFYILDVGPDVDEEDMFNSTSSPITGTTAGKSNDVNDTKLLTETAAGSKNPTDRFEYLVATDANRLALMVYARDPARFYDQFDKQLQQRLQKGGFGGYVFWNQPVAIYQGSDCYYPDEKEIFARRALKAGGNRQKAALPTPILGSPAAQQQQQEQRQPWQLSNPLNNSPLLQLQQLQLQQQLLQQQQQLQQQQAPPSLLG